MAKRPGPAASVWITYEVVQRDGDRNLTLTPVSAALAFRRPQAKPAVAKMQKVEELGWPTARQQLHDKKGRHLIVRADDKESPYLWELKCTPHAWRLFFYTYEHPTNKSDKRLIYVHAIYKKQTAQDDGETVTARNVCTSIRPGDSATRRFPFPTARRI